MKHLKFGNLHIVYTEKEDGNQRIEKNRKKVITDIGMNTVYTPVQKHTAKVVYYKDIPVEADGVFTDRKLIPIGVVTADCMPIVLFDGKNLSILHAGWKGLFSGIIENGLKNHNKDTVKAFIMPSIRDCCYQVKEDFIQIHNIKQSFYSKTRNGIYLSLQKIAKNILNRYGISKIYEIPICTACCDKLYSYRKGDFESRILTFTWFE